MNLNKLEKPDPFRNVGRIERLLTKAFPQWGLKRFFYRKKLELASRAYESVELSRLRRARQDARSQDQINSVSVDKLHTSAVLRRKPRSSPVRVEHVSKSSCGGGTLNFPNAEGS